MKNKLKALKISGKRIILDPDNLFWAACVNSKKTEAAIPERVASLYGKVKNGIDAQMSDFRFGKELTAIYIDPTDKCNADCPYCYVPSEMRKSGRSMTLAELYLILDKISKFASGKKKKMVIIFHASEPLLVKDIIFSAIKKYKNFKFGLQTNAILLKQEDVEFLKKYRVGVGISLDSFFPSRNNLLRRVSKKTGNFKSAIRAIEWFGGYKGLNVIATITKHNVKDMPQLVTLLHAKKVPCVLLNPVRLTSKNSRSLKPDEKLLTRYFIKAVDKAIELSVKTKHKIIVGNFANVILGVISPLARRLMCDISPCGGGRCFFTITASGEMIPCGEFTGIKGFSGGNIFKDELASAVESVPFERVRQRFVEKIDECKICDFRNLCGAPCPAELHSLGNMYKKSIFCDFYKKIIEHAFKMVSEDKVRYLLREDSLTSLEYEYNLNGKN